MIIFRYLAKEILKAMLGLTLILLVILITAQATRFLSSAAGGAISAEDTLRLIALQVPLLLGYLLPLGLYIAILLTLGRMTLDSEMIVLFACGMSRLKITGMIFVVALFVALITLWLVAVAVPEAEGNISDVYSMAAMRASVSKIIPGQFVNFGSTDRRVIFYAEKVEKDHSVLDHVFLAKKEKDQNNLNREKWDVVVAKQAFEKTESNQRVPYLVFNQGYQYSGVPGEKNYHVMQFDQYAIQLAPQKAPLRQVEQYYSMSQLWARSPANLACASELQWRLAMPIAVLTFALLAVPLSEVRPRSGKFTQLFPAILVYVFYANFMLLARGWIEDGTLSPAFGMWWLHGMVFSLAVGLMLYQTGWKRIRRLLGVFA